MSQGGLSRSPHRSPGSASTRKWWGWGTEEGDRAFSTERLRGDDSLAFRPPLASEIKLRAPRVRVKDLPHELRGIACATSFDRLMHSRGRSFEDVFQNLRGWAAAQSVDLVLYPSNESQIEAILHWASQQHVAVCPYGGGSSVSGGVGAPTTGDYRGAVAIDMKFFDRVVNVDHTSMSACVEAGVYGPSLDAQLRPHGVCVRHFTQSYQFSTVGGWVATRAGGHYSCRLQHIDDIVQAVRIVTPRGAVETRRLPATGTGPCQKATLVGSEGIMGVITRVWLRVRRLPKSRLNVAIPFPSLALAAEAARRIVQARIFPAVLRAIDRQEAFLNNVNDGNAAVLFLGFESEEQSNRLYTEHFTASVEICRKSGALSVPSQTDAARGGKVGDGKKVEGSERDDWGRSFKRAPYLRDRLVCSGMIAETFETAVTWDLWPAFLQGVQSAVQDAIDVHCGPGLGQVTCRLTHVYHDGPAPYFTVLAKGAGGKRTLSQWRAIKESATSAILRFGGTVTHHHAVGRMHRLGNAVEKGSLYMRGLAALKREHDPRWILNPGVILAVPPEHSSSDVKSVGPRSRL